MLLAKAEWYGWAYRAELFPIVALGSLHFKGGRRILIPLAKDTRGGLTNETTSSVRHRCIDGRRTGRLLWPPSKGRRCGTDLRAD